ncbi:uncharacterized protein PHALS_00233 [Plasmopara halstedii]|uniref:Uncharacterized protein n=1 Tax=Plasmopara halstedii TaxID=4781 RepID=A0A0N7L3H7_PLAHL|nr:uncharacterized protein PHALS_00233 [Plasmopara halstedii]CEG35907.1 hypothetical protein PHALS_00233 [Plasmopara halstedii]|eukprot:XP_024572276.1 hypothetical protein PHALS_00233 [Plasmopara halstedii]
MNDATKVDPAARSEQEVLAALPPPPSALPDYEGSSDISADKISVKGDSNGVSRSSSGSKLPASAVKASSAARSIANKFAKSGRSVLTPLGKSIGSKTASMPSPVSTTSQSETETSSPNSIDATIVDSLGSVASVAGSLTSGITSSLASASTSFGSLLFASQSSNVSNADDVEERISNADRADGENDAAEAAKLLRQVTAQQRMKILEDLVQHRRSDWNYLKAMHEGSNYWLNVALLREQQVMKHVGYKQSIRRGAQFFYLGLGLGKLIGESTHSELLAMDCCQLLEELEFYFSSAAVQGMKMMVATSSTLHEPLATENKSVYSIDEPFKPIMHKWNQRPVFRRLTTPPIPFPLDYREVLLSLCDILALIYSKLVEDNSASENINLFQSVMRFDDRIKKLFIDPVKKEFSAVASQVIAEEMRLVRKVYGSERSDEECLPPSSSDSGLLQT